MKKSLSILTVLLCVVVCGTTLVSCDESQSTTSTITNKTVDAVVVEITAYHTSMATMVMLVYKSDSGKYVEETTIYKYSKNPLITGDQITLPIRINANDCEVGAYYN